MKTKLAQFLSFTNKIDRRHLQLTYFALMLAVSIIMKRPSDGGTGPF